MNSDEANEHEVRSEEVSTLTQGGIPIEEIARIPQSPGIYIMRSAEGKPLYIGKAANLHSRVQSYFTKAGDLRFNVRFLMRHVRFVETILTANEKEAFLLEDALIKREQPRYNIRLRDDKTYASVRFNMRHEWPRATVLRRRHGNPDGELYLGPFASATDVRQTLRALQRIFPIRSCPDYVLRNRTRPCILHSIGRCCAPCVKKADPAEYREMVQGTIMVLKGQSDEALKILRGQMARHAEGMEYEQAAAVRDRIRALENTSERQSVHKHDGEDQDVIVMERRGGKAAFAVFGYRKGLLLFTRPYILPDHEREPGEFMEEFIARYYANEPPPKIVLADPPPEGRELLNEWLSERRESKSEILLPQRGDKMRQMEFARENCLKLLEEHLTGRKSVEEIQAEIMQRFRLNETPDPIECYDISTFQGTETVGAQVTFLNGEPDKSRYRRYKIATIDGTDDFGSLREMLTRRFKKAIEKSEPLPGLVMIDGGKGQLNVAVAVFEELGIRGVGLVSIAKSRVKHRGDKTERTEERFFLPGRKNPVTFPANSPALHLLQRARDEAHRFGITFHRALRKKRNFRSSLQDQPGVGPKRVKTLLRAFGSARALGEATLEQIAATPGIPESVARGVYDFLHSASAAPEAQPPPLE